MQNYIKTLEKQNFSLFTFHFSLFVVSLHPQIATMAQLVEQRIRNAWVGGSSPPSGSNQATRGFRQGVLFSCL